MFCIVVMDSRFIPSPSSPNYGLGVFYMLADWSSVLDADEKVDDWMTTWYWRWC